MRRDVKDIGLRLRERLSSSEALDRARALRIAQSLGLVKELEQSLYRAASDADPVVRSLVISALAHLPGPTSVRLLRNAVNDPSNRVQANAIETLDRLDAADRVQWTEPKLRSPNSRVRANAARSLLRAGLCQGGETLLDMLEDSSSTHRLSALWVVEKSGLRTALPRVANLSRTDPDQRVRSRAKRVLEAFSGDRTTDGRPPQAECVYPRVRHVEVNR
jgi:HEAT repeat protein